MKPTRIPANPCFSSGPCAKRPGWSPSVLQEALLGRSHRSRVGLARLVDIIERSRAVLQMPADYRLGIVPASDTGAVEMALWSLLGARGVDLLCWENFGEGWVTDVTRQLKLPDVRLLQAHYGQLPDLAAVEPLESYTPPWPLPKLFRLTEKGKLIEGIFRGETINTPSMLCVEDALDSLRWAESVGGLDGLVSSAEGNLAAVAAWEERSSWARFLAEDPATRSCTSIQLAIVDPWFTGLSPEARFQTVRAMTARLEAEGAGYDLASHRASPPGIRIWAGATVEQSDVEALLPWLDWAWEQERDAAKAA